ncbi:hypothetical protein [Actinopolymorpha pittospori]|uniref:Uncharacterized protein n=1 Tax=Actinopolymorpha pittospori TaxID=648752 RepID=A0A927MVJ5_9ACTN|nr:hypothetical protein [Actinopolymorpha pittospori]MBE1604090.1 hypothetical protein [Actinopolymorpha pittospori]
MEGAGKLAVYQIGLAGPQVVFDSGEDLPQHLDLPAPPMRTPTGPSPRRASTT